MFDWSMRSRRTTAARFGDDANTSCPEKSQALTKPESLPGMVLYPDGVDLGRSTRLRAGLSMTESTSKNWFSTSG
jgi:hypothetical protein